MCLSLYMNNFLPYPGLSVFNPNPVGRIIYHRAFQERVITSAATGDRHSAA